MGKKSKQRWCDHYHHHVKRYLKQGWAWTDYPVTQQERRNASERGISAPLRRVHVHDYDNDKYVSCSWDQPLSDGFAFRHYVDIKTGYLYACKGSYFKQEKDRKKMNAFYVKKHGMSSESCYDEKRRQFKESLSKKHNNGGK